MNGYILKQIREEKGISQEELARKTGMTRQKISLVELDYPHHIGSVRYLSTEELYRCADALDVSPSYLLTGNEDENRKCAADELGLSNETINTLKVMDENTLKAFELLMNDPTFGMALTAYMSSSNKGLWKDGKQIASENDDIQLGNITEFSGTFQVGSIVDYAKETYIINTLRAIRRSVAK